MHDSILTIFYHMHHYHLAATGDMVKSSFRFGNSGNITIIQLNNINANTIKN